MDLCKSLYISIYQYVNKRSCSSCMYDFFDTLTNISETSSFIIVLYLDIQKAFDRVPHHLLLCKLSSIGVDDPLLSWFRSYFYGCFQQVVINHHLSKPAPTTSGVIQGSVLGPLLFILYLNDILPRFSAGIPFLFADDIKVIYSSRSNNLSSLISAIQNDLSNVDIWCTVNLLQFSVAECSVSCFCCNSPPKLC